MLRRSASGLLLAVVASLMIALSDGLGLDLQHVALLGAALGGALGLVPHTTDWGKVVGFLVGFLVGWIGFALRAAVLPDAASGRAVAAFIVVAILAAVAVLSAGRLPLWSGLVGAAAIAGAYELVYTQAPSQFLADSPGAVTTVLLAAALGFLATSLFPQEPPAGPNPTRWARHRGGDPDTTEELTDLETVLAGEQQ